MRAKIVFLYESETGKALCDAVSRVLAETAVTFGHTLSVAVQRCEGAEVSDALLDLCADAAAVMAAESDMACLPALADELLCGCRQRELRYAGLIENRSLMGKDQPLECMVIQALSSDEDALRMTAAHAYTVSGQEHIPIVQVPPTGKLSAAWRQAVDAADSLSAPFHAREVALPQAVPEMVYRPVRLGIVLCPPFAGNVLAEAAAALSGAPGMGYDAYLGGQCPLYAALRQAEDNPFGMLRAAHRLLANALKLEQEAACLEAALRNVLQAGWRTRDIMQDSARLIGAAEIAELICQQIEVAGEWISHS